MATIQKLLAELNRYVGVKQYSLAHQQIVDRYNAILPLPVGYFVKYSDDWCDVFVTYIFDRLNMSQLIGRECGVQRHLQIFKQKGIWLGKVNPKVADIVIFDWDRGGFCDHIGIVVATNREMITTIEGNSLHQVRQCQYAKNDQRIVGYARPAYQEVAIQSDTNILTALEQKTVIEVIRGLWDVGVERVRRLKAAGFNPIKIQQAVNRRMKG